MPFKRIICIALAVMFICAAVSCGEKEQETTSEVTETTDTQAETVTDAATTEPLPLTPEEIFKGKTALFVGDAFMAGACSDGLTQKSFAEMIAEKYAFSSVKNTAADAASVSEIPGKPTVVSQLNTEAGVKYDFVIIDGGLIDAAKAVDIGRITAKSADETSPEELDTAKFAGGFENLLLTAKKLFPDAAIGFVITPAVKSSVGCVSDMRRFVSVMRLACEKWGVFVLDMYDDEINVEYHPESGRTASTNMNIYQGNGPEYALDGDPSTLFWAEGGAFEGSTFTVDLGVLSDVFSINLVMGSERYPNNYMHCGVMEYSDNGEDFSYLCDVNPNNRITKNTDKFTARYVRIRSTKFDVEWPLITEFEIEAEPAAGAESGVKSMVISAEDYEKITDKMSAFMSEIYNKNLEPVLKIGPGLCDTASVLEDKKVIYYGDSICDKSFHDDPSRTVYYSYAGRIRELYGTKTFNRGRDSASFSTTRGTNTIIAQTAADLDRKVDMIVIEGGVNDAMDSAPVGVVSDMTADNFDISKLDKTTMAGGLEEVLYTLTENHKEAVIVYMIIYKVDFNMGRCNDMTEYVDTIKALCDKWGVVYLDLYNDAWFNARFDIKSRVYSNDGLHPNAKGYDVLTPVLAEFMADTYLSATMKSEG